MIILRRATEQDKYFIYDLRNNPLIRKYSLNKQEFSFKQHTSWFEKKLLSCHDMLLVACMDEILIGAVRFDYIEKYYHVSIMIDPCYHGKGLGTEVLSKGIEYVRRQKRGAFKLRANVLENNIASVKLFESAGFKKIKNYTYEKNLI